VNRRRTVIRGRPANRRSPPRAPPPLFPTRMTSSSPRAASPTTGQERRRQLRCRLRRQLHRPRSPPTPHLLPARHAWRPGMGPVAQRRPPRLGWLFSKMQLHVYIFKSWTMDCG
jgi:hypothetical protein